MADDFGSGLNTGAQTGPGDFVPSPQPAQDAAPPQDAPSSSGFGDAIKGFGSAVSGFLGPRYRPADPDSAPLDQAADLLTQRVKRANQVVTNPLAQIFAPEQVQAARDFIPKAAETLQTIEKQKQQQADIRNTAVNWGLVNPQQFGPAATDTTLANEALRQWKDDGNFNAYKALSGLSPEWKNRANLYMPDAMAKFGQHVEAVQKGMAALDTAVDARSETAYKAIREKIIKENDLQSIGVRPQDIPETRDGWVKARGALQAQYDKAGNTVKAFKAKQDQLNQAVPVTDEKVAKRLEENYQFGNGETVPGFKAVQLPGYGDVQGVMGPPGSRDTANRGKTWSNAAPEQIKTVREQLGAEEVKGALSKYKMSRDFYNTTQNPDMFKSAAGIAMIGDELGAIGRDVAEGTKAAGSIGLTKMLESKYGTIDRARNKIAGEIAAFSEWRGKPSKDRLSPPSIEGIKTVAEYKHAEALKELNDRIAQPLETAGRYGMIPKNIGLDKEVLETPELRKTYDDALRAGNREIDSYPMVTIGDRRVMLPTGSNIPGAKVAPLDHGSDDTAAPAGGAASRFPPSGPPAGGPATPQPRSGGESPPGPSSPNGPGGDSAPRTPVAPPTGGDFPGRQGLPPGMTLDNPAALEAAANRTIQIESGFKTGQKTGSYVGLGQWSKEEIKRHGITNPDDLDQTRGALVADMKTRAAKLQKDGLPVTAANVYLMHQQGEAGLEAHLRNPDGAAWENIRFGFRTDAIAKRAIWGNMTPEMRKQFPNGVDTVTSGDFTRLWEARYNGTDRTTTGAAAGARMLAGGSAEDALKPEQRTAPRHTPGTRRDVAEDTTTWGDVKQGAINNAPAIGSTVGAVGGGIVGGPPGAVAGGAAGGAVGQVTKDALQGNPQSPTQIAKQAALGGVLGVAPAGRPIVGAAARTVGAGAVEGGAAAAEGGDTGDIADAASKGLGYGLAGEALGRFVSSAGAAAYKALSRYTQPAQRDLSEAAGKLAAARETMTSEQPKLPGEGGPNPKYDAAKKQADEATAAIKDHGQNPDDMVHAYEQAKVGVPAGEAAVLRKAASEKAKVSAGYQELESELPPRKGLKNTMSQLDAMKNLNGTLKNGPLSTIRTAENPTGKVEAKFAADAEHAEQLVTAPAKNWTEKWGQLQNAGTELIKKRMNFLANGDKVSAGAMDDIFQGVRNQQKAMAAYVFGKAKGARVIERLENLDMRWAKIMNATQGMDYQKMRSIVAQGNTPAYRELAKNFREFAGDDPGAMRAFQAMRAGAQGRISEEARLLVPLLVGEAAGTVSGIAPTFGAATTVVAGHRLYKIMQEYVNAKVLGRTVKFADFLNHEIRTNAAPSGVGSAVQRGTVQGQPDLVSPLM